MPLSLPCVGPVEGVFKGNSVTLLLSLSLQSQQSYGSMPYTPISVQSVVWGLVRCEFVGGFVVI